GQGTALGGEVQAKMEAGFGVDFSAVRLHTDDRAVQLATRLGASAFSVGEHIAFGHGEYRPGTLEGDTLIAHELAHVVQARGAAGGASEQALEHEADTAAESVVGRLWRRVTGKSTPRVQLRSGLRLQRKVVSYRLLQREFDSCIYCICSPDSTA